MDGETLPEVVTVEGLRARAAMLREQVNDEGFIARHLELAADRIAELELQLAKTVFAPAELNLSRSEERVFAMLLRQELVTRVDFVNLLYNGFDRGTNTVEVFLSRLRKRLDLAIYCKRGEGWYFPPEVKERILTRWPYLKERTI